MTGVRASLVLALCLFGAPLAATTADLTLPGAARPLTERISPLDSYLLPTAPYDGTEVPTQRFEGRVVRRSWRLDGGAITTLQLLAPLRDQILNAGYEIVFECEDTGCGGFDFRFGTEVVPAPDMHVDIRDFRFLSARRDTGEAQSILVSRSRNAAFVQAIQVRPAAAADEQTPDNRPVAPVDGRDIIESLTGAGHVILDDLDFGTGVGALSNGPYASLTVLSAFLVDNPGYALALVGHSDSAGSLEANVSLSRQRAEAVRTRMIEVHGAPPDRLRAEGAGYLAPIASNLTEAGRTANRRVEAVLLRAE